MTYSALMWGIIRAIATAIAFIITIALATTVALVFFGR